MQVRKKKMMFKLDDNHYRNSISPTKSEK